MEESRNEETLEEQTKEEVRDEAVDKEEAGASEGLAPQEEEKPLDKMTAPELREIARNIPGVTGATAMKKEELLAIIKEYRGIVDEDPLKVKKEKIGAGIRDLKAKIIELRAEKVKARETRDKVKVDILRRRINRLKKQTRKIVRS